MFGLGFSELFLIAVLFIVLGKPEELPGMIRKIGRVYGQLQRFYYTFLDEINQISYQDKKHIDIKDYPKEPEEDTD